MPKKSLKKAFITGITGQDGSYLAELLLEKGYQVHGLMRKSSTFNTQRINHLYQDPHINEVKLFLHHGDLIDTGNIEKLINEIKPDEIYHLGAQSHVRVSFDMPEYTANVDALGALRIFEAVRKTGLPIKIYQASSSEMFGGSPPPQNEKTVFRPRSPYAYSKVFAYYAAINYREAYDMFVCNGILFNHESPRRGETFITRKITQGIAKIIKGEMKKIYLGNLNARRDWGYAPEYVEVMWLMLQQKKADDYVIATGETHSIKEFLKEAFNAAGLGDYRPYIEIDPRYFRPTEVEVLIGDAGKAHLELGWKPKIKFKELVKIMIEADLKDILGLRRYIKHQKKYA